jgi:hypothetical protein
MHIECWRSNRFFKISVWKIMKDCGSEVSKRKCVALSVVR